MGDKSKLTNKQKAFKKHYITNGFNGTQAAISIGSSKKSARQTAYRMLTNVDMQKEISKLFTGDEYVIQLVLADMVKIATSNITDIVTIDDLTGVTSVKPLSEIEAGRTSTIKKIKQNRIIKEVSRPGQDKTEVIVLDDKVEYELWDKQKAQETILKLSGKLTEKIDLTSGGKTIEPTTFIIYGKENKKKKKK